MKHDNPADLLAASHIRPTRRKTAVLGEMMACDTPVSARELYETLSRSVRIDLATVYRTLTVLLDTGIIREIADNPKGKVYEIACIHNPVHAHFKCSRCQKIHCLETLDRKERGYLTRLAEGCDVRDIAITLTGLCPECRTENNR